MYGGISLAVYIYGVARELFELVRATAAHRDEQGRWQFVFPDEEVQGTTAAVYRDVARAYGRSAGRDDEGILGCRFVVDIISGTSAGGLNGVCLAAALAGDREGTAGDPLGELEQLWLNEGDIGRLIADEESTWLYGDDGKPRMLDGKPEIGEGMELQSVLSLLNGKRFHRLLENTMKRMLEAAQADGASRLVEELDLWVTATDLDGRLVTVPLQRETVDELEHRVLFHFRYAPSEGAFVDREAAPFLGFAARATSSFPGAFEPVRLEDFEKPDASGRPDRSPYFPSYRTSERGHLKRMLADGGILDNKPFTGATESLVERRAALPVRRKLLYVEPHPSQPKAPRDSWNVLQTAQSALIGIPRGEPINQDIFALLERNRTIERARDVLELATIEAAPREALERLRVAPGDLDEWRKAEVLAARAFLGPTYASYHRLKVRAVVDLLGRLLAGAGSDPAAVRALTHAVRVWAGDNFWTQAATSERNSENDFLYRFDLPYRERRLALAFRLLAAVETADLERVLRAAAGVELGLEPEVTPLERARELAGIRAHLTAAQDALVTARRDASPAQLEPAALARLVAALEGLDDNGRQAAARRFLADHSDAAVGALSDVEMRLAGAFQVVRDHVEEALGPHISDQPPPDDFARVGDGDFRRWLRYLLRAHYDGFELFDLIEFPLSFGTDAAHTNPVEIYRISPDGTDDRGYDNELLGTRAGHFGAFMDKGWRRHDMAWGRMNAAETIIRATLGDSEETSPLVDRALDAIERSYAAASGDGTGANPRRLAGIAVTEQPDAATLERTLRRLGAAAGEVGLSLGKNKGWLHRAISALNAGLLARGGGTMAALALARALVPARVRLGAAAGVGALVILAVGFGILGATSGSSLPWVFALAFGSLAVATLAIAALLLGAVGHLSVRARRFVRDQVAQKIGPPAPNTREG